MLRFTREDYQKFYYGHLNSDQDGYLRDKSISSSKSQILHGVKLVNNEELVFSMLGVLLAFVSI